MRRSIQESGRLRPQPLLAQTSHDDTHLDKLCMTSNEDILCRGEVIYAFVAFLLGLVSVPSGCLLRRPVAGMMTHRRLVKCWHSKIAIGMDAGFGLPRASPIASVRSSMWVTMSPATHPPDSGFFLLPDDTTWIRALDKTPKTIFWTGYALINAEPTPPVTIYTESRVTFSNSAPSFAVPDDGLSEL